MKKIKKLFDISAYLSFIYIIIFLAGSIIYPPISGRSQIHKYNKNTLPDSVITSKKNLIDSQIIKAVNKDLTLKKEIKEIQLTTLNSQIESLKQIDKLKHNINNLKSELNKYPEYIVYSDTFVYSSRVNLFKIFKKLGKDTIIKVDTLWLKNYKLKN